MATEVKCDIRNEMRNEESLTNKNSNLMTENEHHSERKRRSLIREQKITGRNRGTRECIHLSLVPCVRFL
jgi:hypothetical protein